MKYLYILILSFLPFSGSNAEIYKWVDKNGNIQFSDKVPETGKPKIESIQLDEKDVKKKQRTAELNIPLPYSGQNPSKRLFLERIMIEHENQDSDDRNTKVGDIYTPGTRSPKGDKTDKLLGCKKKKDIYLVTVTNLAKLSPLTDHFNRRMEKFGYSTASNDNVYFANQEKHTADISIAAIIRDVEIMTCSRNHTLYSVSKTSTYLKVEWHIFDNLEKKMLTTVVTEGADTGFNEATRKRGNSVSFASAFANAAQNLLANEEFNKILDETSSGAASITNNRNDVNVALSFSDDNYKSSFQDNIKNLKKGTVTIRVPNGHGSGFIVNDQHVLTNYHVVAGSSQVKVVSGDNKVSATIIKYDKRRDVALIKLEQRTKLPALTMASVPIETGETVYVIGTPLSEDLSHTVTKGIISANRQKSGQRYLQTDAALNPGNSGGPAFNKHGHVV